MGTPRLQSSFVVAGLTYIGAESPPWPALGFSVVSATFPAGTVFANADDLCAQIQAQFDATNPGVWTIGVKADGSGRVEINCTDATFSLNWSTVGAATDEVRDILGYTADVTGQASPYTAASAHDYGFYPAESLQSGTQDEGYRAQPQTIGSVTLGGYSDANHTQGSRIRTRDIVINLQRTVAGKWTELDNYWAFLADIADGRQFTVYPDEADLLTHHHLHFVGPDEIPLKQRWERIWRYFQARWTCQEVD